MPEPEKKKKTRGKSKLSKDMKEILHLAFERAGGVNYLVKQADAEPKAFMALIGRLVPAAVAIDVNINSVSLLAAMETAQARLEPTNNKPMIDITPETPKPLKVKEKE
jgi:hypothetical protein